MPSGGESKSLIACRRPCGAHGPVPKRDSGVRVPEDQAHERRLRSWAVGRPAGHGAEAARDLARGLPVGRADEPRLPRRIRERGPRRPRRGRPACVLFLRQRDPEQPHTAAAARRRTAATFSAPGGLRRQLARMWPRPSSSGRRTRRRCRWGRPPKICDLMRRRLRREEAGHASALLNRGSVNPHPAKCSGGFAIPIRVELSRRNRRGALTISSAGPGTMPTTASEGGRA